MDWPTSQWVLTATSAGLAAYLGSYLQKKAEHRATKEEHTELVRQMESVTRATKSIETALADGIWDRQKKWESKRDALAATLIPLARLEKRMMECSLAFGDAGRAVMPNDVQRRTLKEEAVNKWRVEIDEFDEKRQILSLYCEKATRVAFLAVSKQIRSNASQTFKGQVADYGEIASDLLKVTNGAIEAARRELGVEPTEGYAK